MSIRSSVRLLSAIVLLAAAGLCNASVIYVSKSASGSSHDGSTWSTAFLTVQAGVDAAKPGDQVWVASSAPVAEAYVENITIPNGVGLYGGFAGSETQRSQRNWKANVTILDGNLVGSVVTVPSSVTQPATIDGFTVRNGKSVGSGSGGGLYVNGGAAIISNSTVCGSYPYGVCVSGSSAEVTLANNTITANQADGVSASSGRSLTITNCTVSANGGNGVSVWSSGPAVNLSGDTICGNSGDGVFFNIVRYGSISNSILAFNGFYGLRGTSPTKLAAFSHNNVFGNAGGDPPVSSYPADQGNISIDPKLSSIYRDVHIQPGSPCIDAGDDGKAVGTTDAYGMPRITGAHVDIGADESDGTEWTVPSHVLHVSPTGSDTADGLTWATARKTITGAALVAQDGDEIWVAKGVYNERPAPFVSVALYGGFAGNETDRNARNVAANPTVIDGGGANDVVVSCTRVNTVVDGFTVRNGATGIDVRTGGVTVAHNTVYGNAYSGVAVYNGTATVANNAIYGNGTGGVSVSGTATIVNNTLVGNGFAGVTLLTTAGTAYVRNNILAFNAQYQVYVDNVAAKIPVFAHNNVYPATDKAYHNFTPPADQGNLNLDPLFLDRASANFRLRVGSPCIDSGDDSVVTAGEMDIAGNPRIIGSHVDIGAYEFAPTASVVLGSTLSAPPTAVDGVVYVSGNSGVLYAMSTTALKSVHGFPVDIGYTLGMCMSLNSRPAVYYGRAGKAIYLTTNLGHVVKVSPDGRIAWVSKPLNGLTMSTPAVTPDGSVYASLGLGTTSVASYLFKLDETTGQPEYVSPYLGGSPANALVDRSAAIDQRYAYVNSSGNALGSLAVLNQDNLTVRASFAPGEDALPPYLNGQSIYVATKAGSVYKVNGVTMSADLSFGTLGAVKIGEGVTAGPFLDASGSVYVGTASGRIWKLDPTSGAKSLFVNSGSNSAITGLLVAHGVLAFGTASGTLQQVLVSDPSSKSVETLNGPSVGGPVYDPLQHRFVIATTSGRVYSVPEM